MTQHAKKLLELYGGPVPRYTSYPPATQLQPGMKPEEYHDILASQPADVDFSLYLHIPFCRSLCSYCGCMTRIVHDDDPIENYVRAMEMEISLAGAATGFRHAVSHVHFGGGSPNLLKRNDLERLMGAMEANFNFQPEIERAMEADPRQMTEKKAVDYAHAGINRISLGVQDFQEKTQRAINRIQPFSQVEKCIFWIRDAGIREINFDLIYGLPYQTTETIIDNVHKAAMLGPDRVALFGYAHVPWMRPHQKQLEKHPLPDSIERFAQAEAAREALIRCGYVAIGMDHFARPDDPMAVAFKENQLKRNFQGYTTDSSSALLGFGVSAISRFPDCFVQNTTSFISYRENLEKGLFPIERSMNVQPEDKMRGEIIETLMCYFSADPYEICRDHGLSPDILKGSLEKIDALARDGLVVRDGTTIKVTEQGRPFVRSVCVCFDTYSHEGEMRHARAV